MSEYTHIISIGIALAALAAMIFVGLRGASNLSEEEFLIGGRSVGAWLLAGTMAAGVIGGGVLLVFFEYVFRYGLSAFWIILGLVLGLICLNWVAARYKPLADQQKFYTLPDLYRYNWGGLAGNLATAIIFVWTCGFIIMQLISAGTILNYMTGWPYAVGVVIGAGTVASYLLASGYRAVIATDVLQYCALIFLLVVVAFFAVPHIRYEDLLGIHRGVQLDAGTAGGFFVLGALNIIVSADLWQRIYSARSARTAQLSMYLAAILVLAAALLLFVPAYYAKVYLSSAPANQAAIESLKLLLPPWLLGFGLVGILSTVVSTLDTMVFVLAISVAHDIGVRQFGAPADGRRGRMRVLMFIILLVGSALAIWDQELLTTGLALSSLGLILAPSILLQLTRRPPSSLAVVLGMILGMVTTIALIATSNLTPENSVMTLVASAVGTGLGYVIRRKAA